MDDPQHQQHSSYFYVSGCCCSILLGWGLTCCNHAHKFAPHENAAWLHTLLRCPWQARWQLSSHVQLLMVPESLFNISPQIGTMFCSALPPTTKVIAILTLWPTVCLMRTTSTIPPLPSTYHFLRSSGSDEKPATDVGTRTIKRAQAVVKRVSALEFAAWKMIDPGDTTI